VGTTAKLSQVPPSVHLKVIFTLVLGRRVAGHGHDEMVAKGVRWMWCVRSERDGWNWSPAARPCTDIGVGRSDVMPNSVLPGRTGLNFRVTLMQVVVSPITRPVAFEWIT
jgi:hypothetical protein